MNDSSKRVLGLALAVAAGLGAILFLGERIFWRPYQEARNRLSNLERDVDQKDRELRTLNLEKLNMAKWNKLSLSANPGRAAAEYGSMLKPLLRECGLTVDDFQGPPPQDAFNVGSQKKAKHIVLPFQVRAKGTVASLAQTLEALQRMPVMHRVKTMVVDRVDAKDRAGKLNIQMTIEAMIVSGANNQPKFSLENLAPAATTRMYNEVAMRNPFVGALPAPPPPPPEKVIVKEEEPPPPSGPDPRLFIRLDTIVTSDNEAFLRNLLTDMKETRPMKLRATPNAQGFDVFRIMDEGGSRVVVKGKVLRIDARDVYFQVGDKVYAFQIGQTMAEAMTRPLTTSELNSMELTSLIDADFAKEGGDANRSTKSPSRKSR